MYLGNISELAWLFSLYSEQKKMRRVSWKMFYGQNYSERLQMIAINNAARVHLLHVWVTYVRLERPNVHCPKLTP